MPTDVVPQLKIVQGQAPVDELARAVDYFLTAKEAERCTPATLKHYRWCLERFTEFLKVDGIVNPNAITPHVIHRFLVHMQDANWRSSSILDVSRVIKTWLRFCHDENLIVSNPMAKIKNPNADTEILPAFTPEEVKALLAACPTLRDQCIVYVLLDTGVRANECVNLDWADVDLRSGQVVVRMGKGRKQRVTFLGAKSRKTLMRYQQERKPGKDDPLFTSSTSGERLSLDGLQTMCLRLGKRAKVEHCHPHTFRRTFALWSLRAGMDVYSLQRLMGHSSLQILLRYLALVERDLKVAHEKFGAIDNML